MTYEKTADRLVQRIEALLPTHPEILLMDSPWILFTVDGFECNDLQPTLFQAAWALKKVQTTHGVIAEGTP